MANKQFGMRKKLGTSVCADISQYACKTYFLGWNNFFFMVFGSNAAPENCFWTNIKKMFFAIQYINILQLTKTFVDNMCALVLWKPRNGCNIFFYECDKK